MVAHKYLTEQIQAREVHREYLAVVHGVVTGGGRVEAPIARHRVHRTRMAVAEDGRYAATEYRIGQRSLQARDGADPSDPSAHVAYSLSAGW